MWRQGADPFEFGRVVAQDSPEIHKVTVEVINGLVVRRRLGEQDGQAWLAMELLGATADKGSKSKKVVVESKRRDFTEKPKFGTVTNRGGFGPGEPGLLPDEKEDRVAAEPPDWEKKLSYTTKGMSRKSNKIAVTNDPFS